MPRSSRTSRPHVMLNMAMSLDGKVSSVSREPTTFTSRQDKRLLMVIRSRCDALVVAARTAAIDYGNMGVSDPRLRTARRKRGQSEHPVRVIVSGRLHLPQNLRALGASISPLLIVCAQSAPLARRKKFSRLGRLIVCGKREVNIRKLVALLAREYQARTILCEGGPTLNDAFFRSGTVDELFVTLCPKIVGGRTAPTLSDGIGAPRLKDAIPVRLVSLKKGRSEWFLRYKVGRN